MRPVDEELERVISRYVDGEATNAESAWLVARLGSRSADLDSFVERLLMEAEMIQLGAEHELGRVKGRRIRSLLTSPAASSVLAAVAVIALAAVILSLIVLPRRASFAEWSASPGSVVSVSGGKDGKLSEGGVVKVSQGCVEVRLREGVRCLLQSPGVLTLHGAGFAQLEGGIARFEVEEKARGYRVQTSELVVVDLGTVFGIDAMGAGRGEVHVIDGRVEVSSRSGWKGTTEVTAGEAVALGAVGRLEAIPLDGRRFVESLPSGLPALRFSFDRLEKGLIRGEGTIADREGVRIRTGSETDPDWVEGKFGHALAFGGEQFALSNWPGIGGTQPRTISLWMRVSEQTPKLPYPLIGWGDFRDPTRMGDFGIRLAGGTGKVRVVSGRRSLQGESQVVDGKWHHLVVVLGSYQQGSWPEIKVFIDGKEETLLPGEPEAGKMASLETFSTRIDPTYSQPLILGRFLSEEPRHLPGLRGEIDEVVVAEGVITHDQVRALHEGRLEDSGLDFGN